MTQFKNTIKHGLLLFIILALAVNLVTIYTFPSWFDEAFFANISYNLAQGQGFLQDLIPGYSNEQVLIYGPLYFILQSQLILLFGLDEFVFRLPNLLAGYLSVYLLFKILRNSGCSETFILLFAIAAIADISFNRNLVYGRMDLVALLFVILSLFLVLKIRFQNRIQHILCWFLVGLISSAAYLTTPRALFLLPVVIVVAFYKIFFEPPKKNSMDQWIAAIGSSVLFIVPVLLWIDYAGGFERYMSFFQQSENVQSHIGVSFFRSFYDNVTIGIYILLNLIYFRAVLNKPLLLGIALTYISFSFFVVEKGPYAAMITPLLIAGIFYLLSENVRQRALRYAISALIVIPGMFLIFLRGTDLLINYDCRDHSAITEYINLQKDEPIIIPYKYYFFAEENDRIVFTYERSRVHSDQLLNDIDLVITSDWQQDRLNSNHFTKVVEQSCEPTKLPFLPNSFYDRSTFFETIYSRNTDSP